MNQKMNQERRDFMFKTIPGIVGTVFGLGYAADATAGVKAADGSAETSFISGLFGKNNAESKLESQIATMETEFQSLTKDFTLESFKEIYTMRYGLPEQDKSIFFGNPVSVKEFNNLFGTDSFNKQKDKIAKLTANLDGAITHYLDFVVKKDSNARAEKQVSPILVAYSVNLVHPTGKDQNAYGRPEQPTRYLDTDLSAIKNGIGDKKFAEMIYKIDSNGLFKNSGIDHTKKPSDFSKNWVSLEPEMVKTLFEKKRDVAYGLSYGVLTDGRTDNYEIKPGSMGVSLQACLSDAVYTVQALPFVNKDVYTQKIEIKK